MSIGFSSNGTCNIGIRCPFKKVIEEIFGYSFVGSTISLELPFQIHCNKNHSTFS
jgi:hypothetical protein